MQKVRCVILVLLVLMLVVSITADDTETKISEDVLDAVAQMDVGGDVQTNQDIAEEGIPVVVTFDNDIVDDARSESSAKEELIESGMKIEQDLGNAVAGTADVDTLINIQNNPFIESINKDLSVKAFLSSSVPIIHANSVWARKVNGVNITGAGQTICLIDTGVYYNHSNLGSALGVYVLGGRNTITNTNCTAQNDVCSDDYGHGTHMAGIILSNHSTNKGVAPDARIIAVKALNSAGSGLMSDVIAGIDWCVANKAVYNITVISMSLGTEEVYNAADCPTTYDSSINAAHDANISIVAASGNSASTVGLGYPACHSKIIAVGGSNDNDALYSNTNRDSNLDILAPGSSITSTYIGSPTTFATADGTSAACPHVAAAIALLRQDQLEKNKESLTVSQIYSLIRTTNVTISGYPRLDIYLAIAPNATFVSPTPANASSSHYDYVYINVTTYRKINNSLLEINGTNYTMSSNTAGDNFYLNVSGLTGWHNYTVYMNDSSLTLFRSGTLFYNLYTNNVPVINNLQNISVSASVTSNSTANITVNASDADSDTLYYSVNMSNFTQYSNVFLWNVTYLDTGIYLVNVTVNDTRAQVSQIVKLVVGDITDSDGDGIYDVFDPDDDNDGIPDNLDTLKGNSTYLTAFSSGDGSSNSSSLNISVLIDDSADLNQQFTGSHNLTFKENATVIIEATTNVSEVSVNLYNVTISKQNSTNNRGFLIIKGLSLSSTKTVYVDHVNTSFTTVCVKDADVNNISQISAGCSSLNETLVTCDGTGTKYNCSDSDNGTRYKITGLYHSAVYEQCSDSDGDGYGTSCYLGTDCDDGSAAIHTGCSSGGSTGGSGGGSSAASSGGGGGIAAEPEEDATKSFSYQQLIKGETKDISIESAVLPITKLSFRLTKDTNAATVSVKSYKQQPVKVKTSIADKAYKYMSVTTVGLDNSTADIIIEFKVNKTFVKRNNLNVSTLKLYLYDAASKSWSAQQIRKTGEDFGNYLYSSTVDDFGYLGLSMKENAKITVPAAKNQTYVTGEAVKAVEPKPPMFGFMTKQLLTIISAFVFIILIVLFGFWIVKK